MLLARARAKTNDIVVAVLKRSGAHLAQLPDRHQRHVNISVDAELLVGSLRFQVEVPLLLKLTRRDLVGSGNKSGGESVSLGPRASVEGQGVRQGAASGRLQLSELLNSLLQLLAAARVGASGGLKRLRVDL